MNMDQQAGGAQAFDIGNLVLNEDGTLTMVPDVEIVPASQIKTATFGGIVIQEGQELTFTASREATVNAMAYLNFTLRNAVSDNRKLASLIDEKERELAAAKATSLLGEHTLFPLGADGIPTPPDSPDCFCYLVFPNMRRRVLICNLPVNAGETLRFGDLALIGYSVVIERRAKASPIPGGKPSMGYSLSIESRAGQNCDIEFVPDHAFHERLSDHQKDPIYMGGKTFRGTFQMKRYKSYPETLAILLRDEMIELLKREGWKSPQEVVDMVSAARQLPATSAAPIRDEDRIKTKQLSAARPPAPPPEAVVASQSSAKPSSKPPPSSQSGEQDEAAEISLEEAEIDAPKKEDNDLASAPPSN